MTTSQTIFTLALLAELALCLWLHRTYTRHLGQRVQSWLKRDAHTRRNLRPNSPKDCPCCVAAASEEHRPSSVAVRPWRAHKAAQGRRKQVSSHGYGCPNAACAYYRVTDEKVHALVSDGWRGKRERIRQWRCQACGQRFTSRRHTPLYWLKTPSRRVAEVMCATAEGVDVAAAARIFGHHASTVSRWLRRGGQHAATLHERWVVRLRLAHVQVDELVVRVRTLAERVFVWTAIDSLSKLLVSVHIGARRKVDAMQLIHDVWQRLHPDWLPVFTSDGLNLYFYALTAHFGRWRAVPGKRVPVWEVAGALLYGQLRKHHAHGRVKFASTRILLGTRQAFRAALQQMGLTGTVQTAFVERLNLTLRECIAALSRRTWSIAFSLDSLRYSVEWGRAYYHFVRPHHSLTVRDSNGKYRRRTPAMAAGLTHKRWTVQALLCLPLVI